MARTATLRADSASIGLQENPELINCEERLPVRDGYAVAIRRGRGGEQGRVMIVPPFGVPASALSFMADQLVPHGYEVVLLDPRNSNGDGSGDISQFRMSDVIEDCHAALDRYIPDTVVAVSLGARAVVRALAMRETSPRAVLLLPVVDMAATLHEVIGDDWFSPAALEKEIPDVVPVLGFDMVSERFRPDAAGLDILTADSMVADLEAIAAPVTLLPGTRDPWIDHRTVTRVFHDAGRQNRRLKMQSLPCDQHELHKHPVMALRMIQACIGEVLNAS